MPFLLPDRRVSAPAETHVARARSADALVNVVREATGGVVVVVGPRNSGKTDFIRNETLPRLGSAGGARLFDCALEMPAEVLAAIAEEDVVVLDGFDRFLRLPSAVREPRLEALLVPKRRATLVLVAERQSLADLLLLRKHAPDILDHIFELEELTLANELPRYSPSAGTPPVAWDARVVDALETDLARFADSTVTPELISIIYEGFQAGAYDPKRGVVGLLERYLETSLARIATEPGFAAHDVVVIRALLKEIAIAGADSPTLAVEIARRMDVSDDEAARCKRWLIDRSDLLRDVAGDLVFRPPQLGPVLQMWVHDDRATSARVERCLADALETRLRIGALLAPERFDEIHAHRLLLRTTPDQAAFLARCALQAHPEADPGPIDYWFRRIGEPALETATLIEALMDPCSRSRARAALMLGSIDEPKVHGHLCRLVLEDAAPVVRQQGIESLSRFVNKGPIRDVLTAAATDGPSETRVRAIDALRIFSDEDGASFLQTIVGSPVELEVRNAAIQTLARTQSRTGTSALVRIALDDPDLEDRNCARSALSRMQSEDLTDYGLNAALDDWLERSQTTNGRWWKKLGHWPAVTALLVGALFVQGLPLLLFRRWLIGCAFFAVQIACGLLLDRWDWLSVVVVVNYCASIVVATVVARKAQTPPGTFYRALSNALLANTMLTSGVVLHGLGHWIAGRKRQGWQAMGVELVAIIAVLPTLYLENLFNIAIVRNAFDSLTVILFRAYQLGFLVSWLWSVSSLAVAERWGRRGPWLSDRHAAVLRALLNAPVSALVLRRKLLATPPESGRARMLLERFGDAVDGERLLSVFAGDLDAQRDPSPEIVECLARFKNRRGFEGVVMKSGELLDRLPAGQRAPVFSVLVQHPTDASVCSLWERRATLRPRERVRRLWATVLLPFRDWHWTVWLAGAAGAVLAMLLIVDAVRTSRNPGWPEIKELRRLSRTADASSDVTTVAAFLANRYPVESITELVTLLQAIEAGAIVPNNASGIEAGLGMVATFQPSPGQNSGPAEANGQDARAKAVDALVTAALNREADVQSGAIQALQSAAERRGSPELVSGLAKLFDQAMSKRGGTTESELHHELLAVIVAMLGMVAQPVKDGSPGPAQREASQAIAARANILAGLLLTSADMEVKKSILAALQTSTDAHVVTAIKSVILSDRVPFQKTPREKSAGPKAQPAAIADDVSRNQQTVRGMAVDALRAINTPASVDALLELTAAPNLPLDIATKARRAAAEELNDRARQALAAERLDEAMTHVQRAVAADTTFGSAHGTLGTILYRQRRVSEALNEFKVATKWDEGYAWAYYMQALILESRADYPDAKRAVESAIRTDPSYPWSYQLLANLYHNQNRDQEAAERLRYFQKKFPQVPEIYGQLAFIYHERLTDQDSAGYELAYQANSQLLRLVRDADRARALSAEMNLLECSLTTGRYQEVLQRGPELLVRLGNDADSQLSVHLLILAAEVLLRNDRDALTTLDQARRIYDEDFKSRGKWHDWVYDGTQRYVTRLHPGDARTTALSDLIRAVNKTSSVRQQPGGPPLISGEIFDRLRAALESGTSTERRETARSE